MNKNGKAVVIILVIVVALIVGAGIFFITRNTTKTGVELYNNANEVAKDATSSINSLANAMFNGQYESYAGEDVPSVAVKQLYNKHKANLQNEDMKDKAEKIIVEGPAEEELMTSIHYTVKLEYGSDGLINKIIVSEREKN